MLSGEYGNSIRKINHNDYEEIFIDRDPTTFEMLVKYLRSDSKIYPSF